MRTGKHSKLDSLDDLQGNFKIFNKYLVGAGIGSGEKMFFLPQGKAPAKNLNWGSNEGNSMCSRLLASYSR